MLPILQLAGQQSVVSLQEARYHVAGIFELSAEEVERQLPSGGETVLRNRVGWARTFLKKAELLSYPSRGHMAITKKGENFLKTNPTSVTVAFLKTIPEFEKNWGHRESEQSQAQVAITQSSSTPRELFEESYKDMKDLVIADLRSRMETCSPRFFEELVLEAMLKIGYGGTLEDAGSAIGKSGDGGLDGVIKEDRLGLRLIYLQAKRWKGSVGEPEIARFAGALQAKKARKGVFITTSDFTKAAREYVGKIDSKIILVTGLELAEIMWQEDLGVKTKIVREVKEISPEFFLEDD